MIGSRVTTDEGRYQEVFKEKTTFDSKINADIPHMGNWEVHGGHEPQRHKVGHVHRPGAIWYNCILEASGFQSSLLH